MILDKPNTRKIKILGTEWTIFVEHKTEDSYADAWCDNSVKEIHLTIWKDDDSLADLVEAGKTYLRHEIIHAFLHESGLAQNSNGSDCWAQNEEMVDWIAVQFHKIEQVFKDLNI